LREIEILCQTEDEQRNADAQSLKQEILKILYATDENEEFQSPDTGDQEKTTTGTKLTPETQTTSLTNQSTTERSLVEENVDDLLADLRDGSRADDGATF